jgi:UrcA family protein
MSMVSRTSKPPLLVRASAAVGATLITALGATLIIGAATSAFAAARAAEAPSVRVRYNDLNLATEQGTLALYARIVSAAHEVCRVSDMRDLQQIGAAKQCRAQAIEHAVRDVGNQRLAEVYTARRSHG